jgi:cell division protein FtsB
MKQQNVNAPRIVRYAFIAALLFLLSWVLVWGRNSFYHAWVGARKTNKLEQSVEKLKAVNDSLSEEVNRLQTNPEAAEKVAREKYGLIKENETVYRFVEGEGEKGEKGK